MVDYHGLIKKMHTDGTGYIIPSWRVIDIDNEDDWKRAELMFSTFKNSLVDVDISILITTFNCYEYIAQSINSCLNQSAHNLKYEIIVINDGSTDNTKKYWILSKIKF